MGEGAGGRGRTVFVLLCLLLGVHRPVERREVLRLCVVPVPVLRRRAEQLHGDAACVRVCVLPALAVRGVRAVLGRRVRRRRVLRERHRAQCRRLMV